MSELAYQVELRNRQKREEIKAFQSSSCKSIFEFEYYKRHPKMLEEANKFIFVNKMLKEIWESMQI